MFSLSYLPTAERLTVVVVKARNLKPESDENENHTISENEIHNVYVKVCVLMMIASNSLIINLKCEKMSFHGLLTYKSFPYE
jgi:hypothetical protein